jgi:hypothetical protein
MIEQLEKGDTRLSLICKVLPTEAKRKFIEFVLANQPRIVAVWAPGKDGERHLVAYVVGDPDEIQAFYHYSVTLEIINPVVIPDCEDRRPLELNNYMLAPGGDGPQASTWKCKPHRLVYDLCAEIKHLREQLDA